MTDHERIKSALTNEEQVKTLVAAMSAFNQRIVDSVTAELDATWKLTVRVDKGQLLQCTIDGPEIYRPPGRTREKGIREDGR